MIEERPCRRQRQSEARVTKRYPIAARVSFQWRGADRRWLKGTGVTSDIGASGASILTQEVPPLGAEVEVTVMLPTVAQGGTATGRLSGSGRVVRVIDAAGFAVAVTFRIIKAEALGSS
jgi:PilZ domain